MSWRLYSKFNYSGLRREETYESSDDYSEPTENVRETTTRTTPKTTSIAIQTSTENASEKMTDSAGQNDKIQSDECQLQSSGDQSHKSTEAGNNDVSGKTDKLETRLQKIAEQLYNEYGKCIANWNGSKNQSAIDIAYEKIAKTISKGLADAASQDLNQNIVSPQKEKTQEVSARLFSIFI